MSLLRGAGKVFLENEQIAACVYEFEKDADNSTNQTFLDKANHDEGRFDLIGAIVVPDAEKQKLDDAQQKGQSLTLEMADGLRITFQPKFARSLGGFHWYEAFYILTRADQPPQAPAQPSTQQAEAPTQQAQAPTQQSEAPPVPQSEPAPTGPPATEAQGQPAETAPASTAETTGQATS